MRIQDKIRGRRIAKKQGSGSSTFAKGVKVADELPIPHHTGFVAAPSDNDLVFDHQKVK